MGKFHTDSDAIPQRIHMFGGGFGAMAYWNSHVYCAANNDLLRDYSLVLGQLTLHSASANQFEMGATPSISANGNKDAAVWAISAKVWNGADDKPAVFVCLRRHPTRPTTLHF